MKKTMRLASAARRVRRALAKRYPHANTCDVFDLQECTCGATAKRQQSAQAKAEAKVQVMGCEHNSQLTCVTCELADLRARLAAEEARGFAMSAEISDVCNQRDAAHAKGVADEQARILAHIMGEKNHEDDDLALMLNAYARGMQDGVNAERKSIISKLLEHPTEWMWLDAITANLLAAALERLEHDTLGGLERDPPTGTTPPQSGT